MAYGQKASDCDPLTYSCPNLDACLILAMYCFGTTYQSLGAKHVLGDSRCEKRDIELLQSTLIDTRTLRKSFWGDSSRVETVQYIGNDFSMPIFKKLELPWQFKMRFFFLKFSWVSWGSETLYQWRLYETVMLPSADLFTTCDRNNGTVYCSIIQAHLQRCTSCGSQA